MRRGILSLSALVFYPKLQKLCALDELRPIMEDEKLFAWSGLHPGTEGDVGEKIKRLRGNIKILKPGERFSSQITHLLVGSLGRTEKVESALAAGIPILHVTYITDSHRMERWLEEEGYDLGHSRYESMILKAKVYLPPLNIRRKTRKDGGVFKNWKVLVLMENQKKKETLDNVIKLGGGEVMKWTARHLDDMNIENLSLTHLFMDPTMLINPTLVNFFVKNYSCGKIQVTSIIYITNLLTKQTVSNIGHFNILKTSIIKASLEPESQSRDLILSKAAAYTQLLSKSNVEGFKTMVTSTSPTSRYCQRRNSSQVSNSKSLLDKRNQSLSSANLVTYPVSDSTHTTRKSNLGIKSREEIHGIRVISNSSDPLNPSNPSLTTQSSKPSPVYSISPPSIPDHVIEPITPRSKDKKRSYSTRTPCTSDDLQWWTDEKLKPKPENLKEPFEAVMDLWADYRDPDWCDRRVRVLKYGDELRRLYNEKRKIRKISLT